MSPWQNSFGVNQQCSPENEKARNYQADSSDDEAGDQVVYNHNYLESLRGLYKQDKQDATQCAPSTSIQASIGQRDSRNNNSLPFEQEEKAGTSLDVEHSKQEKIARASLEKLHAFSFGGKQNSHYKTQFENYLLHQTQDDNDFADFMVTQNNLHENSQQFQTCTVSETSKLGKRPHHDDEAASGALCDLNEEESQDEEACTWSRIFKEAHEFDENHQEITNTASQTRQPEKTRLQRCNPAKQRFKFSIRPVKSSSFGKGTSTPVDDGSGKVSLAQRFDALIQSDISAQESEQLPMVERVQELLPPNSSYKSKGIHKRTDRRMVTSGKKSLSLSSNRLTSASDDILYSFDNGEAERDHESTGLGVIPPCPMGKAQTMTDRFREALSAAPDAENNNFFIGCKGSPIGFFNRLQEVLQQEKQQRLQFMNSLHLGGKKQDEIKCMDVRIITKSFEAKLTICKCIVERTAKSSQSISKPSSTMENKASNLLTTIFSPRTSGNLEIEVGNLVRIHPPWKEIKLMDHEKIILCTYFCEMAPL